MPEEDPLPPPREDAGWLPPPPRPRPSDDSEETIPVSPAEAESVAEQTLRQSRRFRWGAVAFVDILGTKAIHSDTALAEEVGRRKKVLEDLSADPSTAGWDTLIRLAKIFLRPKDEKHSPEKEIEEHAFAFSDSIVVTAWRESAPEQMVEWVAARLAQPILAAMRAGVFLRGAISYGQFYSDSSNIVLGPAAVDAHEWSELSEWIGVHLTPAAVFAWESVPPAGGKDAAVIRRCLVPLKGGSVDLAAVDWAAGIRLDHKAMAALRMSLKRVFATRPIPPKDEAKFRNTLSFVDEPVASSP